MISFELTLLTLLTAVIILLALYVLYALEPPAKPSAEEKTSAGEKIPPKKPKTTTKSWKARAKNHAPPQPQTDSLKCLYGFGYLKKRDKNATIPDECLACPRALECLSSSDQSSTDAHGGS